MSDRKSTAVPELSDAYRALPSGSVAAYHASIARYLPAAMDDLNLPTVLTAIVWEYFCGYRSGSDAVAHSPLIGYDRSVPTHAKYVEFASEHTAAAKNWLPAGEKDAPGRWGGWTVPQQPACVVLTSDVSFPPPYPYVDRTLDAAGLLAASKLVSGGVTAAAAAAVAERVAAFTVTDTPPPTTATAAAPAAVPHKSATAAPSVPRPLTTPSDSGRRRFLFELQLHSFAGPAWFGVTYDPSIGKSLASTSHRASSYAHFSGQPNTAESARYASTYMLPGANALNPGDRAPYFDTPNHRSPRVKLELESGGHIVAGQRVRVLSTEARWKAGDTLHLLLDLELSTAMSLKVPDLRVTTTRTSLQFFRNGKPEYDATEPLRLPVRHHGSDVPKIDQLLVWTTLHAPTDRFSFYGVELF